MNKIAAPITGILKVSRQRRTSPHRKYTYATPRTIGSVNVDEPTGFSQAAELLLAAQVLEESEDEAVVVESEELVVVADGGLRATRLGSAKSIIESIPSIGSGSAVGIRGPNLTILGNCLVSILGRL